MSGARRNAGRAATRPLAALALAACLAPEPAAQIQVQDRAAFEPGPVAPGPPHVKVSKRLVVLLLDSDVASVIQGTQLTVAGQIVGKGMYLLDTPAGTTDAQLSQLLALLLGKPGVVWAEPDGRARANEVDQCGQQSAGSTAEPQQCTVGFVDGTPSPGEYLGQSAVSQIHADDAQQLPHPFQSVVAVIDTGVDMSHPLISGNLYSYGFDFAGGYAGGWEIPNGVDDDHDGLVDEAHGHGTHIAGSVLLVDPECRILPIRALGSDGSGSGYRVAESIFYAVDAGAHVINLSLSFQVPSAAVIAALQYAEAFGVTVVTSAGNTGGPILFPGDYDPLDVTWTLPILGPLELHGNSILTVAAVNSADVKVPFSAHGPHVDVVAPGMFVYSSVPGGKYAWWSGTSMATGIASGVAALAIGVNGPFPLTDAPYVLRESAVDVDASNPGYQGQLGEGRVDAWAAAVKALTFP
jgi:hypothetical protein